MILSDKNIIERCALEEGDSRKLGITPFLEDNVQPASYDICLGNSFLVKRKSAKPVDIHKPARQYHRVVTDEFTLFSHDFVLATTREYICLPADLTAQVQGRSSIGRLGIFIQNAGWVDPGFEGEITLELYNASKTPITLEKGMRIGQLIFAQCLSPAEKPYKGKYTGQRGARGSQLFRDYSEE